jgi:DNA polymerase III delta prime subunit
MNLPFIYKYQPIYLKDFEMSEEILLLIRTMINIDMLNILFIGDSGCGKTSLINTIIREYYGDVNINILNNNNILSINSLKEQGISYYRNEVKTFCQTSCFIPGKKKILILDDLDMINEQSQQVFRNCIDKYSNNVHFISSCINTQKVIESIQSRMTIIKIKTPSIENLIKIVKNICINENIQMTPETELFIISISNYSVRIIINYLEYLNLLNMPINIDIANTICTNISFNYFEKYTNYCKNEKNLASATSMIYKLIDKGYSVMDILDNYFLFIKTTLILNEDEKYKIIQYICKYITIFYNIHDDEIELALFTNNLIKMFSK